MDFSIPEGRSVNSETEAVLCSLNYLRLDQAVEYIVQCGRGSYLAKMDIASARAGQVFLTLISCLGSGQPPKSSQEQAGLERHTQLPITPGVLEKLRRVWNQEQTNPDYVILWAACCVGFFGFLRSDEMTVMEPREFDP